jgi:hypothetical protein
MRRPLHVILASLASVAFALVGPILTGPIRDPGASPLIIGTHLAWAHPVQSSAHPHPARTPSSAPVGLKLAVGYREQYRSSAWVPVRVVLHNRTAATFTGMVTIPDGGGGGQYSSPAFSSMYRQPVILPAGGTKRVTLYLPGGDVGDEVDVQFRVGTRIIARRSDSPSSASDGTVTVGTLSGDPQLAAWIRRLDPHDAGVDTIGLTPATLDPVPEALATFDAIVLTNTDSARLTNDQFAALERYVRAGGSLLLVGGPDWQETLQPLARALVPGTLAGSQTLPNLSGLQAMGATGIPPKPTVVSRLVHPRGFVVAQQSGIPLVVRNRVGSGRIIYLAFDPAVDPIASWRGASALSTALVHQATTGVISRLSVSGFQTGMMRGPFGSSIIRDELANVPGAMQPTLMLLIVLVLLSIAILGPLNFLVFRHLRRPELAWIALPVLSLVLLAATVSTTLRFKGKLVLLNTVGVVQMDGNSGTYPAALYVGLFSSVRGTYHLVWNGRALPQGLPQFSFDVASPSARTPVGFNLSEGSKTAVDFPSMSMWSTRSVALRTTVRIAGGVRSNLHVAPDGAIAGTIQNDTALTLKKPAVLAGNTVLRLADLKPHSTRDVRIRPSIDIHDYTRVMLWDRIYGQSPSSGSFGTWDGDPWEEPTPGSEVSLVDRLRNVGDRLPNGQGLPASSEVVLIGWSEDSLGPLTVDGTTPQRRDLNLIEVPLTVHFTPGTFELRPGTLSAYLVDGRAQSPQNGCCPTSFGSRVVGIGPGGSAIFQFDIPNPRRTRFHRLVLSVNAGGADGTGVAQVYDWRHHHWVHVSLGPIDVELTRPSRFISTSGALQVRLHSTPGSGDIVIADPRQDVQLSGTATVD